MAETIGDNVAILGVYKQLRVLNDRIDDIVVQQQQIASAVRQLTEIQQQKERPPWWKPLTKWFR